MGRWGNPPAHPLSEGEAMLKLDPWRIEAACRSLLPALNEELVQGWLCRSSGGQFRRNNSATPGPEAASPAEALADIEGFFAHHQAQPILRILDFAGIDERAIMAAGYGPARVRTTVLTAPIPAPRAGAMAVTVSTTRDSAWFAARDALSGETAEERAAMTHVMGLIADPLALATIEREGRIVALGYAVVAEGIATFGAIRAAPEWQRRGLARSCMEALLGWAGDMGAEAAALQVEAENDPAQRLYAGLGFATCAYRYHYRFPAQAG
jgi:ribosomal protein S18 acetylase RimI-like enzyme